MTSPAPLPAPLMTVLGFFNPHGKGSFPSPLTTLVTIEGDNAVYGVYSETHLTKIIQDDGQPATLEQLTSRDSFIDVKNLVRLTDAKEPSLIQARQVNLLLAFGIAANDIVIGTAQRIFERIDHTLLCDQYSGPELEALEDARKVWKDRAEGRKPNLLA